LRFAQSRNLNCFSNMTLTFAELKRFVNAGARSMWEQVCISAFGAVVLWILFARVIDS